MSFESKLLEKHILPAINQKGSGDLAVILQVDYINNTATINIANATNPEEGIIHGSVPIPYIPGIDPISLTPGDRVWVQYQNGDRGIPFITTIYPQTNQQYANQKSMKPLNTRFLLT